MEQAAIRPTWTRKRFYLLWILANSLGWFLGWGIGRFGGALVLSPLWDLTGALADSATSFSPALADLMGQGWDLLLAELVSQLVEGAVTGAVISGLQWLVLRRCLTGARWWVPASAVGWALGQTAGRAVFLLLWATDDLALFAVMQTAIGVGMGGLIGLMQWFILRKQYRRAGWWIPVSALALTVGWGLHSLLFVLQGLLLGRGGGEPFLLAFIFFMFLFLVGEILLWFVGGGLFGAITGFLLTRLKSGP